MLIDRRTQAIIILRGKGWTLEEIAHATRTSKQATSQRIRRARRVIQQLQSSCPGDELRESLDALLK